MTPRHSLLSPVFRGFALSLLVLSASSRFAAAQALDTPSATVAARGFFRIDLEVQAGGTGTPNGFTLQWMRRSDFQLSGWPADPNSPRLMHADFTGDPTLNLDPSSTTFQLAPNGSIQVQVGDLFDETGVDANYLEHLVPGGYVFRVIAKGSPTTGGASAPSSEIFAATNNPECTQGFWKTHPEAWPLGCTPMLLGTVPYTQPQLLSIFNTPAAGNGILSLAHQLIAVKLNICHGSNPATILATIAAADALIGGLVIPPIGGGFLSPSSTSALTDILDNFNNGLIPGVVDCPVSAKHSTWSGLKTIYR